jgi:hypothetical protein
VHFHVPHRLSQAVWIAIVFKREAMATSTRTTRASKVSTAGRAIRPSGLKRVELWVPDTSTKTFARRAHRDSVAVRDSPYADDDQAFVDAISAWFNE